MDKPPDLAVRGLFRRCKRGGAYIDEEEDEDDDESDDDESAEADAVLDESLDEDAAAAVASDEGVAS